ncbi:retrovirus-related Pol polyprotein from type-1 retrotransposable element R2 isoform X1 [Halyomorpha halys]|uniref:retrovirus-related Pol polyprotein from type-1 retrotransposable element R2 isoform X1 n=1 Tax=Halyomorpha halys TaxID=286706 RepID=UPI0034D2D0F9
MKNRPRCQISVETESIRRAIKSTSLDTSPGPDGVLIRTIKFFNIDHVIKRITKIMLKVAYVPEPLRRGRTILIYKGKGDANNISSWRPISIYSIVRRISEKVLDCELRKQVTFHRNQRGFIKGLPGAHVNARIIDEILKDARSKKSNCAVVFLDVVGAFDNVGHDHIVSSLKARGVSPDLGNVISALLTMNNIKINVGAHSTSQIRVKRGVPQDGALSSSLFNLAIDHLYRDLCEQSFVSKYGYKLNSDQGCVVLTGFADYQAVSSCDRVAAERVIDSVQRTFKEIGLALNPQKSVGIVINKGELESTKLSLENGDSILTMKEGDTIKYLGCTFSGELQFNEDSMTKFNMNLDKLVTSCLLKPEQKVNIVNQYVFSGLNTLSRLLPSQSYVQKSWMASTQ